MATMSPWGTGEAGTAWGCPCRAQQCQVTATMSPWGTGHGWHGHDVPTAGTAGWLCQEICGLSPPGVAGTGTGVWQRGAQGVTAGDRGVCVALAWAEGPAGPAGHRWGAACLEGGRRTRGGGRGLVPLPGTGGTSGAGVCPQSHGWAPCRGLQPRAGGGCPRSARRATPSDDSSPPTPASPGRRSAEGVGQHRSQAGITGKTAEEMPFPGSPCPQTMAGGTPPIP